MSNKYKHGDKIPLEVITTRLRELIGAVTAGDGGKSVEREFTMRVPAELDRDADCILSEARMRLESQERDIVAKDAEIAELVDFVLMFRKDRLNNPSGIISSSTDNTAGKLTTKHKGQSHE